MLMDEMEIEGMEKKAKVPKLRFPGFAGEWESKKLGDIVSKNISNGIMNRPGKNELLVKDINVVNMYTPDKIHIDDLEYFDATEKDVQKCDVTVGDVFLTRSSLKAEGIAEPNVLLDPGNFVFDDHLMQLKLKQKYCPHFVKVLLETRAVKKQFIAKSKTATMTTIGQEDIISCIVCLPEIDEQDQISAFFIEMDNLITLHQRKLTHLQAKKKCLLQKMFPKKGERFPELRFPGFTGEWEQRKLGELMNVTSVKRIHQSDWTSTGVRFFRARDIVSESKGEKPEDILYISTKKYDEYSALSGKVKVGDLLVTGVGTIGVPMLIKSENPIYFKDGNIIWFQSANKIDGFFFYYTFISESVQRFIKDSAGIGTVGTYTIDSGKRTPIIMPSSVDEQQKIGEFFKSMDNLINLHQRKLIHLQTQKKALLQQMFV